MSSDTPFHPDDEALVRLACGEASEVERARILRHLDSCEDCAEVWSAVEHVRREAPSFDPGAPVPGPTPKARGARPYWLGLAAAAVLALVVVPFTLNRGANLEPPPSSAVRSSSGAVPALIAPREAERIAEPSFAWNGMAEAQSHSFELVDGTGELLWQSAELTANSIGWPADIERAPGTYYWRVVANLDDPTQRVASPLASFELIAAPDAEHP